MKKIILLILILGLALFLSCHKKSPTETTPENNTHPQVDIPWPSLADSPWPMFHHDPQSTGRSQYAGPSQGKIKWTFKPKGYIHESIAIGQDSTIYFVSLYEQRDGQQKSSLYAVKSDGTLKWRYLFDISSMDAKPLVTADGTIYLYVSEHVPSIYVISSDGKLSDKISPGVGQIGDISIGLDGILYFTNFEGVLYAMTQEGTLLWSMFEDNGYFAELITFSPDGNTLYLFQNDSTIKLCAIDLSERSIKWRYPFEGALCLYSRIPLIDNEGNIYVGMHCSSNSNQHFYSISPKGELNWNYEAPYSNSEDATMDPFGNIYFQQGATEFKIVSLDHNGNFRWQKNIDKIISSLISDKEGIIYIFQPDATAFTSKGEKLWQVSLDGQMSRITSAAIGYNGILYVGTYGTDSKIYAIE